MVIDVVILILICSFVVIFSKKKSQGHITIFRFLWEEKMVTLEYIISMLNVLHFYG